MRHQPLANGESGRRALVQRAKRQTRRVGGHRFREFAFLGGFRRAEPADLDVGVAARGANALGSIRASRLRVLAPGPESVQASVQGSRHVRAEGAMHVPARQSGEVSDHGFETVFAHQQDGDAATGPRDALDIDVVAQAVSDEQQVGSFQTLDHLFQCAADLRAAPRGLQGGRERRQFRRCYRLAGPYGIAYVVEFPQRESILRPQLAGQPAQGPAHRFVTAQVSACGACHGARRVHGSGVVHQHREVQVGIALAGRLDPHLDSLAVAAPALQQARLPSVDLQVDGHVGRDFRHHEPLGFGPRVDSCQPHATGVMTDADRHVGRSAAMDEIVGFGQARGSVDLAHGHRDAQPSAGPRAPQDLGPAGGDFDRRARREVGHGQRVDAPQDFLVQHGGLALFHGFLVRLAGLGATLRHAVQHALPDARGQPEERGLNGNRDRQQGLDGALLLVAKGALGFHQREASLDRDAHGHRRERNGLPLACLPARDECRDRVDQAFLGF